MWQSLKVIFVMVLTLTPIFILFAQNPELVLQTGHAGSIRSIDFSPDDRYILSGSDDKTVKLWEVATGRLLRTFEGHSDFVTSAAFSKDGRNALSASNDGTIDLWDVESGQLIQTLTAHTGGVISAAYDLTGRYIISAGKDSSVKIWDIIRGQGLRSIKTANSQILRVEFSPDRSKAVLLYENRTLQLLDLINNQLSGVIDLSSLPSPTDFRFSPNGCYLVINFPLAIALIEISSRKIITTYYKKNELLPPTNNNDISNKRTNINDFIRKISNFKAPIEFSPDGKSIIIGTAENTIERWYISNFQKLVSFIGNDRFITKLKYSSDGRFILAGYASGNLDLFHFHKLQPINKCSGISNSISRVVVSPNGQYILLTGENIILKLLDTMSGQIVNLLTKPSQSIISVAFSPDSYYAFSYGDDNIFRVWDITLGKNIYEYKIKLDQISSVSKDGVLSISKNFNPPLLKNANPSLQQHTSEIMSNIEFWTSKLPGSFNPKSASVREKLPYFKSSSTYKLSQSQDFYFYNDKYKLSTKSNLIEIRDISSGKIIHTFKGHTGHITSATFLNEGKYLISTSTDNTLKFWDIATGSELLTLIITGDEDWAAITPDGRFDGSLNGLKKLHYSQGMKTIPLDAFFEQFYTSRLLSRVLWGEDVAAMHPIMDLSKQIKLPPLVEIISPKSEQSFSTNQLTITVKATNQGGGIDEIRLYQNSKLIDKTLRGFQLTTKQDTSIISSFNVILVAGRNEFRATAFNQDRTESEPAVILIELTAPKPTADLYIITVGLNEYKNANYNLNYGKPDAVEFLNRLEKHGKAIFKKILKLELHDKEATRDNIIAAFEEFSKKSRPEDVFVFFYAGHGVMSENDQQVPSDYYLALHDAVNLFGHEATLAANGISATELRTFSTKIKAQKQLFVLDACQAGSAVNLFALRGASEEKAMIQLARSAGIMLLASSGNNQYASEFGQLGHGVFTYALLEGLAGKADGGAKDGKITVKELEAYLNDAVPQLTQKYRGVAQYPNSYTWGQDFPLGVVK